MTTIPDIRAYRGFLLTKYKYSIKMTYKSGNFFIVSG